MNLHKTKLAFASIICILIAFTVFAQDGVQNLAIVVNGLEDSKRSIHPSLSIVDLDAPDTKNAVENEIIRIGNAPNDVQIQGDLGYVVNTYSDNVQVIALRRRISLTEIATGDGTLPEKIAFVDESKAYVTCNGTDEVKVVDLNQRRVVKTIPVGSKPWGVTVLNGKAYVTNSAAVTDWTTFQTNYGDSSVTVIDTLTDTVLQTIPMPTNATNILTDGESRVLVQSTGDFGATLGTLVIIDANSDEVEKRVKLRLTPGPTPVINSQKQVFIGSFGGMLVYDLISGKFIHDRNDLLKEFGGGAGMAIDSDDNVYITVPDWSGGGQDDLRVMGPDYSLLKSYRVGTGASFVAIGQLGLSRVAVADVNNDGVVNIFDLVLVAGHFGEEGAAVIGDLNSDGIVNILDLAFISAHFGEQVIP